MPMLIDRSVAIRRCFNNGSFAKQIYLGTRRTAPIRSDLTLAPTLALTLASE